MKITLEGIKQKIAFLELVKAVLTHYQRHSSLPQISIFSYEFGGDIVFFPSPCDEHVEFAISAHDNEKLAQFLSGDSHLYLPAGAQLTLNEQQKAVIKVQPDQIPTIIVSLEQKREVLADIKLKTLSITAKSKVYHEFFEKFKQLLEDIRQDKNDLPVDNTLFLWIQDAEKKYGSDAFKLERIDNDNSHYKLAITNKKSAQRRLRVHIQSTHAEKLRSLRQTRKEQKKRLRALQTSQASFSSAANPRSQQSILHKIRLGESLYNIVLPEQLVNDHPQVQAAITNINQQSYQLSQALMQWEIKGGIHFQAASDINIAREEMLEHICETLKNGKDKSKNLTEIQTAAQTFYQVYCNHSRNIRRHDNKNALKIAALCGAVVAGVIVLIATLPLIWPATANVLPWAIWLAAMPIKVATATITATGLTSFFATMGISTGIARAIYRKNRDTSVCGAIYQLKDNIDRQAKHLFFPEADIEQAPALASAGSSEHLANANP